MEYTHWAGRFLVNFGKIREPRMPLFQCFALQPGPLVITGGGALLLLGGAYMVKTKKPSTQISFFPLPLCHDNRSGGWLR
jgi:hypothetical protein